MANSVWLVMGYPVDNRGSECVYVDRIFTNEDSARMHCDQMNGYSDGSNGNSRYSFQVTERLLFTTAF